MDSRLSGLPATFVAVYQQPGANALQVSQAVRRTLAQLRPRFPDGLDYTISLDTTEFVRLSIDEVIQTLFEAIVLVVLVVYLFLQSFRATLICSTAVVVALLGTFPFMLALGFSVNLLTLFGLVLAIGIVVDDAIVVVENVERNMSQKHFGVKEATINAMNEVWSPVIATVLVMASIFVPAALLPGTTGQLYKQFAITIAISVAISGFVALTLTPALCGLLIRHTTPPQRGFFAWFNRKFDALTQAFGRLVVLVIRRMAIAFLFLAAFVGLIVTFFKVLPTSFVPNEDQGYVMAAVIMPDAASLDRTDEVTTKVDAIFEETAGVADRSAFTGYSLLDSGLKTNAGTLFVMLKPYDERYATIARAKAENAGAVLRHVYAKSRDVREGLVVPVAPPAIPGIGTTGGFEFWVQDLAGGRRFAFGLVIVFLVLAAQYESWTLPGAVMTAVPFGIFGALLFNWLRGLENDVYFQIGLLVLIGLGAKNALLRVTFAVDLRRQGRSLMDATIEAGEMRLRPIIMTSLAFVLGVLPLAVATGVGANSRHSIGTGIIGGMVGETTLAMLYVPLFFYLFETLTERLRGGKAHGGAGEGSAHALPPGGEHVAEEASAGGHCDAPADRRPRRVPPRGVHARAELQEARRGRASGLPVRDGRGARRGEHGVVAAVPGPGARPARRRRPRPQPDRAGRRGQRRAGRGGPHRHEVRALPPGGLQWRRLAGPRLRDERDAHPGARREPPDLVPAPGRGELGARPLGPHPPALGGRAGGSVRHAGGSPRRRPLAGLGRGDELRPAPRLRRAARDRAADEGRVRRVGAAVRAAAPVRRRVRYDGRAGAGAVRDGGGCRPGHRVRDRADRERPLRAPRPQPGRGLPRAVDHGPHPAAGALRDPLGHSRAASRRASGRAGARRGERPDRRGQGALLPDDLADRRLRHGERRSSAACSRGRRGSGATRARWPGRSSPAGRPGRGCARRRRGARPPSWGTRPRSRARSPTSRTRS